MRAIVPIIVVAVCRLFYAFGEWAVVARPRSISQLDKFRFGLLPTASLIVLCVALYYWQQRRAWTPRLSIQFTLLSVFLLWITDFLYTWRTKPPEQLVIELQFVLLADALVGLAAGLIAYCLQDKNIIIASEPTAVKPPT